MSTTQFAQGDLLFERLGSYDEQKAINHRKNGTNMSSIDTTINGKIILERGEKTGHAHVVEADKASVHDLFSGQVIVVDEPVQVTHEEHSPLLLQPGAYQIHRQRQQQYPAKTSAPRYRFD